MVIVQLADRVGAARAWLVGALLMTSVGCASRSAPAPGPEEEWDVYPAPVAPTPAPVAAPVATIEAPGPAPVTPDAPLPAPPAPVHAGLSLAELGWPADTRSVEVTATVHVRRAPGSKAPIAGKVVDGTRADWHQVIAVVDRCPRWIELAPQGWVCLDQVAPRAAEPVAIAQPVVTGRSLVPGTYFDVREGGTQAYASAAKVRAGEVGEELGSAVMLRSRGEIEIDGVSYQRTNKGLVPSGDLWALTPSAWAGIDLRVTPPPSWPFAYALVPGRRGAAIKLRAAPERTAASAGSVAPRTIVGYGTERDGYVEVAPGGWALRTELHRVAITAPPPGVGDGEPWIDVDLDEQVLIAYRGTTPEFATLVSSGIKRGTTPLGTYRVRSMAATTRMIAEPDELKQYDVGEVPWAIRFRKGLFLHAAYWHDSFGSRHSHGCVNLAPRDARFLYEWAALVPDGWSELELERGRGMVVRVRDAGHPEPPFYGYADETAP